MINCEDGLERLKLMRLPFREDEILQMCRPLKKDAPKERCSKCGGYHGMPAIQLDYVGHAALTNRLLDVDPCWFWLPLAMDEKGLPLLDSNGGLWIKLTICGVTRLGYGDAQGKTGGDAMKERIGDALRNAAMRFGAALDLWHKGKEPLYLPEEDEKSEPRHPWGAEDVDESVKVLDAYTSAWDTKAEDDPSMLQVDRNAKVQSFYAAMQCNTFEAWKTMVQHETKALAVEPKAGWTKEQVMEYDRLLGAAQVEFLKHKTQPEFEAWVTKYREKKGAGDAKTAIAEMESKVKAMKGKQNG
jgi:hypothetical protein